VVFPSRPVNLLAGLEAIQGSLHIYDVRRWRESTLAWNRFLIANWANHAN